MRNFRIYIDQNIVGYVHEGSLELQRVEGIDWIYSNEHFNEIARSGTVKFLSALEKLRAQQIEIQLDERFRITDNATIHAYSSPFERYEQHIKTINSAGFDSQWLTELAARFFGADNYFGLRDIPEEFRLQAQSLLDKAGILDTVGQAQIEQTATDMCEFIESNLRETRSLESLRKLVGIDKGRVGNPMTENPIQEIWEAMKDKVGGLTADQFFGFDPKDKQGYDRWPMYLGIVGCHTALNVVGYGTDKGITSANNLPNILSDATHIAYAAFCDAVMSEDSRFCKKAKAIYEYRNHHTQVLQVKIRRCR